MVPGRVPFRGARPGPALRGRPFPERVIPVVHNSREQTGPPVGDFRHSSAAWRITTHEFTPPPYARDSYDRTHLYARTFAPPLPGRTGGGRPAECHGPGTRGTMCRARGPHAVVHGVPAAPSCATGPDDVHQGLPRPPARGERREGTRREMAWHEWEPWNSGVADRRFSDARRKHPTRERGNRGEDPRGDLRVGRDGRPARGNSAFRRCEGPWRPEDVHARMPDLLARNRASYAGSSYAGCAPARCEIRVRAAGPVSRPDVISGRRVER